MHSAGAPEQLASLILLYAIKPPHNFITSWLLDRLSFHSWNVANRQIIKPAIPPVAQRVNNNHKHIYWHYFMELKILRYVDNLPIRWTAPPPAKSRTYIFWNRLMFWVQLCPQLCTILGFTLLNWQKRYGESESQESDQIILATSGWRIPCRVVKFGNNTGMIVNKLWIVYFRERESNNGNYLTLITKALIKAAGSLNL